MSDRNIGRDCVKGVGCDAVMCKFNDSSERRCTADNIKVMGIASDYKHDTYCETFSNKEH